MNEKKFDVVSKAKHYNEHPSGVEAIEVCRELDFNLGNCFKYVFRYKGKEPVRSLKSALWYFQDHRAHLWSFSPWPNMKVLNPPLRKIVDAETDPRVRNFFISFHLYLQHHQDLSARDVIDELRALIDREETVQSIAVDRSKTE